MDDARYIIDNIILFSWRENVNIKSERINTNHYCVNAPIRDVLVLWGRTSFDLSEQKVMQYVSHIHLPIVICFRE